MASSSSSSSLRHSTFSDEIYPNLFLGSIEAFIEELSLLHSPDFGGVKAVLRCIPPMTHDVDTRNNEIKDLNSLFMNSGIIEKSSIDENDRTENNNNNNKREVRLLPTSSQFHVVAVEDDEDEDIFKHLGSAVSWLEARLLVDKAAVLVHCRAGVSRSATVCAAFLSKQLKLDVETVLDNMREHRPRVNPNLGFLRALVEWNKSELNHPSRLNPELISRYSYRYPKLKFSEMRVLHTNAMNLNENEKKEMPKEAFEEKYPTIKSVSPSFQFDDKMQERMRREKLFDKIVAEFVAIKKNEQ